MACGTQLGADSQSLPLESAELCLPSDDQPLPKRVKLDPQRNPCKDSIKWLRSFSGDKLIPFVKNSDTGVVHVGTAQMTIQKSGSMSLVNCLSKECSECDTSQCTCLCHLLQAFYWERDIQ